MECKNEHFRHILLFYFRKGKNVAQAAKKLRNVYVWWGSFKRQTVSELVWWIPFWGLKIPKSTIVRHIQRLGLVKKLDTWIPHKLKEIDLTKRINAWDLHLKRNKFYPFLKRIITDDEKWIVYNNVVRKRSWSKRDEPPQTTSKAELHQKKIMLSVWWGWKGVVFFELLSRNQTIASDVCCRQLNKLNAVVKEKRPELVNHKGVIFHHDNSTPHTSLASCQKWLRLGW